MSASLPRTIYDFFIRKWFLSSILLTLSTGWLSLIQIFGKTWGFVDDSGDLKESICYVTWFFVFISVVFALLKTIADKYNEDAKNNGQYVLEKLLQSMNSVTTKKMNRFIDFIASAKDGKLIEPFLKITQPREQIISILENIQITLSDLFGISRSEIGISIIYKHNTETNWDWLIQLDVSGDLTLDQILNNPSASARQIIDNKKNILFYADKRVGRDAREYLPAPKDESYKCVGSIISRDISIGNDNKYVKAILNISTYGKQFCEENDSDTREKILNVLLPPFIKRIQLEMSLLHIRHLVENANTTVERDAPKAARPSP